MRRIRILCMAAAAALSTVAATTLPAADAAPEAPAAGDIVLTGGKVLTMLDGPHYREMDIVVRDGRFAAAPASTSARVIDLRGAYVIPGLAEIHAHVPQPNAGERYRDDVLFLWVANGVTRARGMLGHAEHLQLREALLAHEVLGPALTTSGPSFSGASVRAQKAAGYDFLKIHPGLSQDAFAALVATAQAEGMAFAGHVTASVGLFASLDAGQQTIDHLDGFLEVLVPPEKLDNRPPNWFASDLALHVDETRIPALIAALKESGTAVIATETLMENVAGDLAQMQAREEVAYLPANLRRNYARAVENLGARFTPESAAAFLTLRKRLLREAFEAGVPVLLGADAPQIFNVPGFATHRELESTVAAGISPFDALTTATVAPARFFGQTAQWGSIAPGRDADLVVLREDPLQDISRTRSIDAVMVRGRYLDREELDAGLAEIRARYAE